MMDGEALVRLAEGAVRIARAEGAEHAEAFVRESRTLSTSYHNGNGMPREGHDVGIGLRVASGGRVGISGSTGLHRVPDIARAALRSARLGAPTAGFEGFAAAEPTGAGPSPVPAALRDPSPERLEAAAQAAAGALDHPGAAFWSLDLRSSFERFAVANDQGLTAWDQGAVESFSLELRTTGTGDDRASTCSFTSLAALTPERVAAESAALLGRGLRALQASPLDRPVDRAILGATAARQVVAKFLESLSGRIVNAGQSPMSGRLGEQVASPLLDIVDRPSGDGIQRLRTDHEGVPTRATPILEHGVLVSHLHDTLSGRVAGCGSNGHALRRSGWGGAPAIAPIYIVVADTSRSLPDMVGETDEAVLIEEPLRGIFTTDTTSGAFSVVVPNAELVQKGEVVRSIPNATVGGNVFDILKSIDLVGRAPTDIAAGRFAPVRCEGITCAN